MNEELVLSHFLVQQNCSELPPIKGLVSADASNRNGGGFDLEQVDLENLDFIGFPKNR